jgi:ATP/maltotriose-dependent transcriptional regulator MalT
VLAFFPVPTLREPGWLSWPVHYLSALVEVGRLDDAEDLLPSFEAVARDRGSRSRLASLARIRGELATARRHHGTARDHLEEALTVGEDAVDALEHGLALLSYGRFLRRRGERRAAADRLSAARTHFVALGARPFVERCDHELAASGLVVEPVQSTLAAILTPQERLVAGLACKGMSNKEMAHHLVLSVKTVGYHLANVYTKLDVHSRAQLIARLSDA